jgi:DNA processing protein
MSDDRDADSGISAIKPVDAGLRAALSLSLVSGIGPRTYRQLVGAFGGPQQVLQASPSELRSLPGVGAKLCRAIVQAGQSTGVDDELQRCRDCGIELLELRADDYPQRLREIADPPALLYCQGKLRPQDGLALAIVGTRHGSPYGLAQANRFARGLALAGLTIVSGLARGIDAAAHRGALEVGGRTLAILGSGILELYPAEHRGLADEIGRCGAVLSEFPLLQPPKAGAFPQRNRLISGLSLGVLVIEAATSSGALISARHAMEQGREVFALPGRVDSRNSRGCHRLIRDGAKLVESVDDILEELGPLGSPIQIQPQRAVHHPAELRLNDREQTILQAIDLEPTSVDAICAKTRFPVSQVLATLSVLEMRRLIRRVSGNSLVRL